VIRKLLIANRGEIVTRVMRTCRSRGIKTVAVYSEADKDISYLKGVDEAYCIGPANPIKSYLNIEAIIDVAKKSGVDAIHPGYGFLSENSQFAEAVTSGGIIWVGPPPPVLKAVDSKCTCRQIASGVHVPVVPGTIQTVESAREIRETASELGYPIILKLDKGGGGKGIEVVHQESQVEEALERLSRIGLMAFGHPECYVETEVLRPRHIEVQFLADGHGNCVCLGERECSIQRRYQKIIEESPSPVVSEEEREKLFDYTARLVGAMGYQGAGTMEFLRSPQGNLYFMEVNARLQVEHPVTECLTGVDIVDEQLRIAGGEATELRQENIRRQGHAIEARVYAEDPITFMPSPGTIGGLRLPQTDARHVRVDHAIERGAKIPPFYDPLVAKVIAWDVDRPQAIDRLIAALSQFCVEGIKTTIPTNIAILMSDRYAAGDVHTGFIQELFSDRSVLDDLCKPLWPCM